MFSDLFLLNGKVATIVAGGLTEYEIFENLHRFENTVQAARAAYKGGIVAGGGKAYLSAIPLLKEKMQQQL